MEFNLADLFECVADAVPERTALVHGERRYTFAELDARANRLAHHFLDAGLGPGDHIGLYLYSCSEYIEAALAAFKIRAAPVNINFRYVEDELRYLFDDADLAALVYHREFAPRVAAVVRDMPALRHFVMVEDGSAADDSIASVEYEAALAASSPERGFAPRSGDDLYLLYTGGTTGMPKGVMWRQEDMFFGGLQGGNPGGPDISRPGEIADVARSNESPRTTLPVAPLMHGNGHWAAMIGMHGGGKVVIATSHGMDSREIWSLVEREQVHVLSIVGDAMARPLAAALGEPGAAWDLSSMLVISSGGAIFSEAVKQELRAHLPNTLLIDAFGASEVGHQGMNLGANESGKPRFNVDATTAVLDDDLRPVPPGSGAVGRVARRGRMPIGYYKDEAKTAATFVTDADGVRWVIPGDSATVEADGSITLLGRGSVCINSGGEKIYPEEVEAALKSHAAIYDAIVVGIPDERWGERVAAVVQLRPESALTLPELDAHARTRLSAYKVPRHLSVVDEVQRSPSGKADYKWAKAVAMGEAAPAEGSRND
jgi:acyl-CoA synthetase (AMP-forming)/AMP-acid ligase II